MILNSSPCRLALILPLVIAPCLSAQDVYLQNMYQDEDYRQRGLFEGLGSDESDGGAKTDEGEKLTDLLHFSLAGGIRYDDNIYLDEKNEVDDVIFSVSPTLAIRSGREGTAQNTYSFAYTPSFLFYTDNSDSDTIDHRASFRYTTQMPKSKISLDLDFSDTDGADRYSSGSVARTRLYGALHWNYLMTGKTRLDLTAYTDLNDFKTAGYNDQQTYGLRAAVLYQLTGKTSIGPSFGYSHTNVDDSPNQDSYNLGVKMDYQATGKTVFTGTVGYNTRTFDGDGAASDEDSVTWSLGVRHQATAKTSFRGIFYREPKTSYNLSSTGYMATGLSLSAQHQLSERANLFAVLSYENDDYYETGAGGADFENNYYTATFGGSYVMPNGLTLGANMTYRTNDSDYTVNEFDNFSCGINASYNFW